MAFLRKISGLLVGVALFLLTFVAWNNRLALYDWWRLRSYVASPSVAQLATDTAMNPSARHLFYVQHPDLQAKDTFRGSCDDAEHTIVLGCYRPGVGIYILRVEDARLAGVQQVTAAHEMLHAAYDRLSGSERSKVNSLIKNAYAALKNDRITSTINQYQQAGADTTDELHSILGTEVRQLPPELESYYQRYFSDRGQVVSYSERYEKAFTDRKNKVEAYDAQLAALKTKIDKAESDLTARGAQLEADRARLDALLTSRNTSAYNAAVPTYNAQVQAYNALIATTKADITTYNQVVIERNAIALEEQELVKAIDSRLDTIAQ